MLVKEEHGGEVVVVVVIWKGQTRHAEGTLQEFSARQVPLLLPFPSLDLSYFFSERTLVLKTSYFLNGALLVPKASFLLSPR